ncbi:hypothetical protein B9Z55_005358 [Caenorhabditis nigoni]|uniref:RNase H type-1 domain-containing protein n=1 Tax=Caenorhabditis nigoni TaxID=1611254 RepID=A0A2G5V1B5_9PELO|nr:hypothetical protein B9Z55_005358 [Caenorhabditis nigoni]
MIRWFRNLGTLFKKPRGTGIVKTETTNQTSQRVEEVQEVMDCQEDRRSLGGKGGGGGGGGGHGGGHGGGGHGGGGHGGGHSGGHGGSHGGGHSGKHGGNHGSGHGGRSSHSGYGGRSASRGSAGNQHYTSTKSNGRTGRSASTNTSNNIREFRNSEIQSSMATSSRNYSTTTSTRSTNPTNSSNTIPTTTSTNTYSQKTTKSTRSSSGYSTSSIGSTASKSADRSVSSGISSVASGTASQKSCKSTASTGTVSNEKSRGRSTTRRDNINSAVSRKSQRSRSRSVSRGRSRNRKKCKKDISKKKLTGSTYNRPRPESPGKSTKGPHVSRKDAALKEVLSPTNRASQLNRSHSALHEKNYHERQKTPNGVWNEMFPKGSLIMYTDGSYLKREHRSGIGIFVAPGHELNRSQRIHGNIQDNNFAEFLAVKTALQNALKNETYRNQKIVIRTDCLNVIEALKGIRGTAYPGLKNEVESLAKYFPKGVDFQHVYAHEGDPGNELADTFAGIATGKSQGYGGGFRRNRSASRERNRLRSKSNDPAMIRSRSHSIQGRL